MLKVKNVSLFSKDPNLEFNWSRLCWNIEKNDKRSAALSRPQLRQVLTVNSPERGCCNPDRVKSLRAEHVHVNADG